MKQNLHYQARVGNLICMSLLAVCIPAAGQIKLDLPPKPLPSGYIPRQCLSLTRSNLFIDCWLAAHPKIANSIVYWFDPASTAKAWPQWDEASKQAVRDAYKNVTNWYSGGMVQYNGPLASDPPINLAEAALLAGIPTHKILTNEDAWTIYSGHVGLSLAVEINGLVPWSLRNYSDKSLAHLFNSVHAVTADGYNTSHMFVPAQVAPSGGGPTGYVNYSLTPSNATTVFKFLKTNSLISDTPKETIGKVLKWSSKLHHSFCGWGDPQILYAYWQYYAGPTVSRMMEGTVYSGPQDCGVASLGVRNYTMGCGGTVSFWTWLLRTVNIPVMGHTVLTNPGYGHGGAWFSGENLFISHGDSPYDSLAANYYAPDLLLTAQTFAAWFPPGDFAAASKNIDRRVVELAVHHPGPGLLKDYCQDQQQGKDYESGKAYERFKPFYTVAQLQSAGLWGKLAAMAISTPGCLPLQ